MSTCKITITQCDHCGKTDQYDNAIFELEPPRYRPANKYATEKHLCDECYKNGWILCKYCHYPIAEDNIHNCDPDGPYTAEDFPERKIT